MSNLTKLKNYLWRPYEIESRHPVETIQNEISDKVIQGVSFQWLPDGKLRGKVAQGEFTISYKPLSSIFMRGAGSMTLRGVIESKGKGSRIYGYLPGPPFAVYLLLVLWVGFYILISKQIIQAFLSPGFDISQQLPLCAVGLIFPLMAIILFFFDRFASREGEAKILGLLKQIAE